LNYSFQLIIFFSSLPFIPSFPKELSRVKALELDFTSLMLLSNFVTSLFLSGLLAVLFLCRLWQKKMKTMMSKPIVSHEDYSGFVGLFFFYYFYLPFCGMSLSGKQSGSLSLILS